MNTEVPQLNDRAQGWLNFLYLKATTPDDWSEKGTPHEWWDKTSTAQCVHFQGLIYKNQLMQLDLWLIEHQLGERFIQRFLMK